MKHHVKHIVKHPLISGSSILFIGAFLVNFLGYLFNLIMGRLLSVEDYGLLAALTSLLVLFGIFQTSFTGIFAKFAAKYKAQDDEKSFGVLISHGSKFILIFSAILLAGLLAVSPIFASFIKVDDIMLLIFIFLSVATATVFALPIGILKGEMKFLTMSILGLINPILKIVLGVLFVWLGMEVFGVVVGILISVLIPVVIGTSIIFRNNKKNITTSTAVPDFFTEFKSYSWKFFLATIGLTVISNADIILVRTFFEPVVSGQYAALSLMGKAIFYFTSPVYSVFFPLVAQKTERNESVLKTLFLTIGLISSISIALSFVYFLAPGLVLSVFFPADEYQMLRSFLGPFSLYIAIFAIVNLFNNFFLSMGRTGVYKINLIFAGVFVLLFYFFHSSLYQVIGVLFTTSFLLLVSYLLYYYHMSNGKD